MKNKKDMKQEENGYLFSVEVLVNGQTNGHALEKLTRLLNTEDVIDYRIVKGINLGQVIAAAQQLSKQSQTPKKEQKTTAANQTVSSAKSISNPLIRQIEQYKDERKLVRLSVVKEKGVKLSVPCRILNYDVASGNITIYHVDEKKVYQYQINEIDDLT